MLCAGLCQHTDCNLSCPRAFLKTHIALIKPDFECKGLGFQYWQCLMSHVSIHLAVADLGHDANKLFAGIVLVNLGSSSS